MSLLPLPRLVVSGLAGDTGKTLVSLGLARALDRRGLRVAAFKKGPDYIDAAWLALATGRPAHHLDTYLMSDAEITTSLSRAGMTADFALVEGNRGLFDGVDAGGTHSTAALARRIQAPIILVIDASKATRTLAALVLGCRVLEPDTPIAGVILNRVGTRRHEQVARDAIEAEAGLPVLGVVPRLTLEHLPSRHLGLLTPEEHADGGQVLAALAEVIERSVDIPAIRRIAAGVPLVEAFVEPRAATEDGGAVRIGVLRDAAFSFYYTENLTALERAGATLVPISPLADRRLPAVDALYAGGGFPEEHAPELSANTSFRDALAERVREGMPVWAECGGLMYLATAIRRSGVEYPMAGVLPVVVEQTARPQGHGYVEACVDQPNPFFAPGTRLRGHEFHYSRLASESSTPPTVLALTRGAGIGGRRDGIVQERVFASYLHLLAPGAPEWAPALVRAAKDARAKDTSLEDTRHRVTLTN